MAAEEIPLETFTGNPISSSVAPPPASARRGIAPVWHTVLLVLVILGISFFGSGRMDAFAAKAAPHRLAHYALSGAMELALVAFVYLGVRLRKLTFRTLLGEMPRTVNDIAKEVVVALLFWIGSMIVLACFALTWSGIQTAIYKHHRNQPHASQEVSPQKQQIEMAKKLMQLAPADKAETIAWGLLCLVVGFSEETVFRGYLQLQGISLFRRTAVGLVLSALVFGAAHGYQGLRGMFLITIYGALFGGIALLRRNLFPGMVAHSWHDFATGMFLAFIRQTHFLDRLPTS